MAAFLPLLELHPSPPALQPPDEGLEIRPVGKGRIAALLVQLPDATDPPDTLPP